MRITIDDITYNKTNFSDEDELERAVVANSNQIFGNKTVYFDIKKRIKNGLGFANIPDGYVLDFRDDCKLWVVENELSRHDALDHIGIQLLKFATQFATGSYAFKEILMNAVQNSPELRTSIEELVKSSHFPNLGEALDFAIFRNEFGFVVVIDEITEDLQSVSRELARQPELLLIEKYVAGEKTLYRFDELLKELDDATSSKLKELSDIDTIVCPARPDGFKSVFLGEKIWHAIRISPSIIPKLRYIAMYEVSPVSAIQWVGKIQAIKPYQDTGKYVVYTSEIFKVGPIKMDSQKYVPQGSRFTKFDLIEKASKLSDIF